MNYTEGIIQNTEFFTTTELAQKLKMNVQVITRKVQAGEIMAYKIGKEWRIPEPAVFEWLESNTNTKRQTTKTTERNPSSATGKKLSAKAERNGQERPQLEYILAQFEPNRSYSTEEVDRIISRYDADCPAVREQLISSRMMGTEDGQYRRQNGYRFSS